MIHKMSRVLWCELRSKRIFNCEPVLTGLEEGTFGEPAGCENLEWVWIVSWLQQLLVRLELDDHLLHGNNLFHLSVEVFKLDGAVAAYMAPLDAIELEKQVLCLEGPSDFDIDRARDGVARHVP